MGMGYFQDFSTQMVKRKTASLSTFCIFKVCAHHLGFLHLILVTFSQVHACSLFVMCFFLPSATVSAALIFKSSTAVFSQVIIFIIIKSDCQVFCYYHSFFCFSLFFTVLSCLNSVIFKLMFRFQFLPQFQFPPFNPDIFYAYSSGILTCRN